MVQCTKCAVGKEVVYKRINCHAYAKWTIIRRVVTVFIESMPTVADVERFGVDRGDR